jgi:ATP-dependent protease HslVU (ClpYQ) peptidase subunit
MTCIVGLAAAGKVFIGADSAGLAGLDMAVRADRKVFRNGEFIIGFTSSFRMGQLLAVKLAPPKYHPDVEPWRYMVEDFVEAVRRCLREGGFSKKADEVESGGHFLVGFRGRVFHIESDFQVGERVEGFDATGCGESFALGSLLETGRRIDLLEPRDRVLRALKAAETFSAGVRSPFHIEEAAFP